MHSISTSVFNGRVLTATHLHQLVSIRILRSKGKYNVRPTRLNLTPILHINRIHIGKVIHIRQKDIHLEHLCDVAPSRLEDVAQVFDTLMLGTLSSVDIGLE